MKHQRFIETCIEILGIKAKIDFLFHDAEVIEHEGSLVAGLCQYYIDNSFGVEVAIKNSFGVRPVLAHELCHIAVELESPKAKTHGRKFQEMARFLENSLLFEGYTLETPIYDPRTDL